MPALSDFDTSDTTRIFLTNISYTEEGDTPVVHLFGRDDEGNYIHREVTGHRPHFSIPEDEYSEQLTNHYAVTAVERDGRQTLDGEDTYRVETALPEHVGDLRELFDRPLEADVLYETRWLIDNDITTGVEVPEDCERCDVSDVSPCEAPNVEPRICTVDIEVACDHGFPDADDADWPVVSIVAHDNYADKYVGWLLTHDDHDLPSESSIKEELGLIDVMLFDDEQQLLDEFNKYIEQLRPDILTGWNSNNFDYPYLINRCRDMDVWSVLDWSPLQNVYTSSYGPVVDGVSCLDMLGAYEKTQIHEVDDKSLDAVAADEVDAAKLDVGDDYVQAWQERPVEFLRYNKRDVSLVTEIDDAVGATDLFTNLRHITGVGYEDPVGGNFELMDTMVLRKALEYDYVLPTAEKPEIGDLHGGYVYDPVPGLHDHVLYPDWSSLYPNLMYQCNMSPETLIGTESELRDSPYDESDCVWSYIDTTTPPDEKEDTEATDDRLQKVYFLAPDHETGFIRLVLDDVMGLADEYSGGMYEAVKRIRNSAFGFCCDSDSYGTGSRLYDWRLGEAITLGGQKVLKRGGEMFADFVSDPDARVIYGDTDSNVTTLPNAPDGETALEWGMDATEQVNDAIDDYTADTFGLPSPDNARMELECESYASRIFFKSEKKRYAQLPMWDDDSGWLDDPDISITGFEYVRSDVAQVTKDVQYDVLEVLLRDETPTFDAVKPIITDLIDAVMDESLDDNDLGIRFGMSEPADSYGSPTRTPMPQFRGARYANEYIYGTEAIDATSDPMYFYIDSIFHDCELPQTYRQDTAAQGDYVDAISVLDASDIPDGVTIDRPKMVRKTILSAVEDIVTTMDETTDGDWDYSELETYLERATPADYYRDESQMGLDAENFM
jgi:DNA polymerase elongation subunit (family B)